MFTRVVLPILAGIGLLLGLIAVVISRVQPPTPPIPIPPPQSPYEHYISAAGMVEASSHNISIGSPFVDVIAELFVEPGDFVTQGTPLFRLFDVTQEARVAESEAKLETAESKYQRLLDLPRAEDVSILEAKLEERKAFYLNQLSKFELIENLDNPRAVSRDERNQRRFGAMQARFSLREAQESLAKALAGTWIDDLNISRAVVKEAKENVAIEKALLDRRTVRAPFSGTVLRINRFPGELVTTETLEENPVMLFGVIDPLFVRVDVDEEEIWRIIKGAPGKGFVRGNRTINVDLEFVRIDPYLIPKRALNGTSAELVDTRVLQVLYRFKRDEKPIYPGQLLDIFLKATPSMEAP